MEELYGNKINKERNLTLICGPKGSGKTKEIQSLLAFTDKNFTDAYIVDYRHGIDYGFSGLADNCNFCITQGSDINSLLPVFKSIVKYRKSLFKKAHVKTIKEYEKNHEPLKLVYLVIDRYEEFIKYDEKTCKKLIKLLLNNKNLGISMIVATRETVLVFEGKKLNKIADGVIHTEDHGKVDTSYLNIDNKKFIKFSEEMAELGDGELPF